MKKLISRKEKELIEKTKKRLFKNTNPEILVDEFPMFTDRQILTKYFIRYEIFKKILKVKGSIVECGVYRGGGLMLLAKLSTIYEPFAFTREIIGFDTFKGFPNIDEKDGLYAYKGGLKLKDANLNLLKKSIRIFDLNRPIEHIPKIHLVKGDSIKTIPKYFKKNPHMLVALLYLDFDLYEATKIALKTIIPRMPKGAIVAFDELNDRRWPGETIALLEELDIRNCKIEQFPGDPHVSFIRL